MVSASKQLIDMHSVAARGRVLPEYREIGCDLAVEQGHLPQFRAGELTKTARVGLGQERRQPVPVGPAFENPLVGEDLRHGRKQRPEF